MIKIPISEKGYRFANERLKFLSKFSNVFIGISFVGDIIEKYEDLKRRIEPPIDVAKEPEAEVEQHAKKAKTDRD